MELDPVVRGKRAEQLLEDEILVESLEFLEASYLAILRHGKTLEQREEAHKYLSVLDRFKAHLKSVVVHGSMSAKQIEELEGRKRFWRV